jgi:hypothetical protein
MAIDDIRDPKTYVVQILHQVFILAFHAVFQKRELLAMRVDESLGRDELGSEDKLLAVPAKKGRYSSMFPCL